MFSDSRKKPSATIFSGLVLCLVCVGFGGVGCRTDGLDSNRERVRTFNSEKKSVDSILLFTSPLLFNLDKEPGPDGFSTRVYAVHNSVAKPIPLTEGTLEITVYDGLSAGNQRPKPHQVWSYSKVDLPRYLLETSIGFGYDFILKIDKSKPLPRKVSIGAKYTPPDGNSIFAKPVSIAIEL